MSITLTNLLAAVRSRADMVGSTFVDDTTELTRWINEEAAELHDLVVSRFEDQFTILSSNLAVSSGNTISLSSLAAGAPFYKMRGLDVLDGKWCEVAPFAFNERNRTGSGLRGIRYRLIGASIYLTPTDAATGTYRLWYIPGFVDLVNPGDTLDYPENWHEFVISGAAAKALAKEESDPRVQQGLKEASRQRILASASNRDAGRRMRIEDVRSGPYGDDDDDSTWDWY